MAKFCTGCGNQLEAQDKFCTKCGKKTISNTPENLSVYPLHHANRQMQPVKHGKITFTKIIAIIAGFLIILLGVQSMTLNILGKDATATIISARQSSRTDDSGVTDPRMFDITYEFSVQGTRYTGSSTQLFKYGLTQNQTITVRYLPQRPSINKAKADTKTTTGILFIGLGILVMFFGIMGKFKSKK